MSILIKGKLVHFDGRHLHVELEDDRIMWRLVRYNI